MSTLKDKLLSTSAGLRDLPRAVLLAGGAGGALLIGTLVFLFVWPHAVLRSYLFAYVFWLNVSLGAFGWLALSHVTGGAWGRTTRRFTEAASGALPLLAVLGLPLVLGAGHLFAWADVDQWQCDPVLLHRRPWISTPWVVGRAILCFTLLISAWLLMRRASTTQDRMPNADEQLRLGRRMRAIGAVALPLLFVSVSLLAVDWIMALEPHWISSIFGLIILTGQATAAIALVILAIFVIERTTGRPLASADRVHDLGKLLLTSVVLWAYMSFSQYLIQWMGHTQEDIHWYVYRLHGGWSWVAAALCVFGLGVPMLLLLSRPLKRCLRSLAVVAAWVFVTRILDVLWMIAPTGSHDEVGKPYLSDLTAWLGIGGLWLAAFAWHLSRAPLRSAAYLTSGENISGVVVEGTAHA